MPGKSSTTEIREMKRVTSKLRINNATPPKDAGVYSCQASNAFGASHFRIDLSIWGKKVLVFCVLSTEVNEANNNNANPHMRQWFLLNINMDRRPMFK